MRLRRLLFAIHLYGGLAIGLLFVLTGVTGTILVFRHELEAITAPELFTAHAGAALAPLETIERRVRAEHPGVTISSIRIPNEAGGTYQFWVDPGDRQLFVDPYTGALLGERVRNSSWLDFLFDLHAHLAIPDHDTGDWIVGLSGFALLIIAVSGLYLWWPGRKKLKVGLTIRRDAGTRRLYFDIHRVTGAVTSLLLIIVTLTGIGMVFYESASKLLNAITRSSPIAPAPKVKLAEAADAVTVSPMISFASAVSIADQALPGGATTRVVEPRRAGAPMAVRKRMDGEQHPNGRSFVYLDPTTGAVLRVDDARRMPIGTRLTHLIYPIHIGAVGGVAGRLLVAISGLVLPILLISGVVVWWKRTRRRVVRRTQQLTTATTDAAA